MRLAALRKRLAVENLDAALISHGPHLRYLCGYSGSNGLLFVGQKTAWFFTDFRYAEQAKKEVPRARIIVKERDIWKNLADIPDAAVPQIKIGFQASYVTYKQFGSLRHLLPKALMVSMDNLVEPLTMVKDADELAAIRKAVAISDLGFVRILEHIRPGVRENDIAAELEYIMKKAGSEMVAFETIVASGARAALPHGIASNKKIAKGDLVTMDFGATYRGYVSDITRTVVVGKPTARQKQMYALVKRAQKAAVNSIKPGKKGVAVDKTARSIIERAGFGKQFGHGLGHGFGLYVHEGPALSTQSTDILRKGMVVTVEPGVYFPGWGGVRIEDDIVVTTHGAEVLNKAERGLICL